MVLRVSFLNCKFEIDYSSSDDWKKRENKAKEKTEERRYTCTCCKLKFQKLKFEMFCHSCYKTYTEVAEICEKKGGCFDFTDRACEVRIICANGHEFNTQFKTKM